MSSIGRSLGSGGLLSVTRLLAGIVRIKIVALVLGAAGVGVFSFLVQISLTAVAVTTMSLAVPIINLGRRKVVAEDFGEAGAIAGTALAMIAFNWAVLTLAAILFGGTLLAHAGAGANLESVRWPIIVAVLFSAFSSGFWEGMTYLCNRFDIYVRVGMAQALADMTFTAIGAWIGGLHGAILAMPLGPATAFIAYTFLLSRDENARQVLRSISVKLSKLPNLLSYSAIMFSSVAMTNLGLTFLRSRVIAEGGPAVNGYLQTVTAVAAYVLAFVMTGFWGHVHARAAAAGDTDEMRTELNHTLRLGLLISFTGCGFAAVLSDFVIPLFYSPQFTAGARIMTTYMPGEVAFQLLSMIAAYQLTVSRRRRYFALNIGYISLLVALGIFLIPALGALGYVIAHVVSSDIMVVAAIVVALRLGQVNGRFVVFATSLIATISIVCGALLYEPNFVRYGLLRIVCVIPFLISGSVATLQLIGSKASLLGKRKSPDAEVIGAPRYPE
jgi:O-antigen/teichoic acid export membrane protein